MKVVDVVSRETLDLLADLPLQPGQNRVPAAHPQRLITDASPIRT